LSPISGTPAEVKIIIIIIIIIISIFV